MNRQVFLTLALVLCSFGAARAQSTPPPDTAALLAPVNAWAVAFNSAQTAFPSDAFTDDCTVIDEFPPFAWASGPQDVRSWYAYLVGSQSPERRARFLASKQHVTFDPPRFVREREGGAYLVFPSVLTYVSKGVPRTQRGTFVVAERKTSAGWRISANSWAIDSDD